MKWRRCRRLNPNNWPNTDRSKRGEEQEFSTRNGGPPHRRVYNFFLSVHNTQKTFPETTSLRNGPLWEYALTFSFPFDYPLMKHRFQTTPGGRSPMHRHTVHENYVDGRDLSQNTSTTLSPWSTNLSSRTEQWRESKKEKTTIVVEKRKG